MEGAEVSVQTGAAGMTGAEWDARLEMDVALRIKRFMSDHPAPADSACAQDFARWAENLLLDGRARLAGLAAPPLRVVH